MKVLVDFDKLAEVAKEFRVSVSYISSIVSKIKKNKAAFDELYAKMEEKQETRKAVQTTLLSLIEQHHFIDSAKSVRQLVKDSQSKEVTIRKVREVMREDCEMSYRSIKRISIHGNSPKNLVLHQQFAIEMLKVANEGKVLLCIDETWLGMSDFRRMMWRVKGTTNSVISV